MFSKISLHKIVTLVLVALSLLTGWGLSPALAASDPSRLTVALSPAEQITLTDRQFNKGKQLFNIVCAQCHVGGASYTNPDVGLKLDELALATPRRDNVLAIVDYVKNPTSYDGTESLLEYHPNTQLTSEYPKLRNLTDEDLKLIASYVLVQANTLPGWGGSKSDTHSDLGKYLS